MMENNMKNLKSKKLYLQVYEEIKNYISKNHLGPGDKLPSEMKMSEMLGVSRNVLREAIKSLEITGIVRSTPGVGIIIQEFNTDLFISNMIYDINDEEALLRQVEELRRVLELGFSPNAFQTITQKEINQMGDCLHRMETIAEELKRSSSPKYGSKFAESDALFHKTLFSNVDNRLLKSIIEFFWACDRFYKERTTLEGLGSTLIKHQKIYTAVKEHDYNAFYEAMQYHFHVDYYKH